ncbi:MAG: 50S ribosomal protein L17 [Anaerolineales bacterium]|nr:50S ribosomal protein L17 [Anaerolineales bacterium]
MRHRVSGRRLGRSSSHRRALRRNLITQLFVHGQIETTEAKARAIRPDAEKLITLAKRGLKKETAGQVHSRRLAASRLYSKNAVSKLFEEIAPRYENRPGGYTRMLKIGRRLGDNAEMAVLELVDEK